MRNPRDPTKTPRLTNQEYRRMLASQGGACAICGVRPRRRRLAIDHDHETGAIRGLLCGNCNLGIGHFADDPGLLQKAASYLDNAGCPRGNGRVVLLEPLIRDAARSIAGAEMIKIIRGQHRRRREDPEKWKAWALGRVEQNLDYVLRKLCTVVRVVHPTWSCAGMARVVVEQGKEFINHGAYPQSDNDEDWRKERAGAIAGLIREELGQIEVMVA